MSQRHEERYKRAVARITPERRAAANALALKECGFVNYDTLMMMQREEVDKLAAHKLGERFAL